MARKGRKDPRWRTAVAAFTETFPDQPIGFSKVIGSGLSRKAYLSWVGPEDQETPYVALVPNKDAPENYPDCVRRETALLRHLSTLELPFDTADIVRFDHETSVVIQTHIPGFCVDFKSSKGLKPWDIVGELAAAVHCVSTQRLTSILEGFETRRAHAESCIASLTSIDDPIARDAYQWACEHLPPATPARLLHSDLLGQNIHYDVLNSHRFGLVDWETALLGDPAFDLAIVTRATGKPFGQANGLQLLLDAYNTSDPPEELEATAVHLHELGLVAHWWHTANPDHVEERQNYLRRMRNVLNRAATVSLTDSRSR